FSPTPRCTAGSLPTTRPSRRPPPRCRRANGPCRSGRGRRARARPARGTTRPARGSRGGRGPRAPGGRGGATPGQFGGTKINSYPVWLGFCVAFLLGLVDWRRPLSVRNLDLLVLISFSVPLWFFNRGNIFASVPLLYPAYLWLIVRCAWVARRD